MLHGVMEYTDCKGYPWNVVRCVVSCSTYNCSVFMLHINRDCWGVGGCYLSGSVGMWLKGPHRGASDCVSVLDHEYNGAF